MNRGVSTVLDVSLCLLLVSAAVLVLVTAPVPADPPPDRADETADVLATSTATVHYALQPTATTGDLTPGVPGLRGSTRDTVANLLAAAATRNLSFDGRRLSTGTAGLVGSVENATNDSLNGTVPGVQVTATWVPYRGAPLSGTVTVGDAPPADVAVHAATVAVPSGFPHVADSAETVAVGRGFEEVAAVVANATVEGLFPPAGTRLTLASGTRTGGFVAARYRRAGQVLNTNLTRPLETGDAREANARLATALTAAFTADMRRRFDSPTEAAATVDTGSVVVVVRTWSP